MIAWKKAVPEADAGEGLAIVCMRPRGRVVN